MTTHFIGVEFLRTLTLRINPYHSSRMGRRRLNNVDSNMALDNSQDLVRIK